MSDEVVIKEETPAVEEKVVNKVLNEPDSIDPMLEPYTTNPFFYEVANYFGVEQRDYEIAKDKLSVIVDWASHEAQSKKPEDILVKIRELEDKVQSPDFGERRFSNVYKYVRLATRRQALDTAMSAFEKKGIKNNAS